MEHVSVTRTEAVGRITMNRPESNNSINPGMSEELHEAAIELVEDESIRCIVLTGTGKTFTTGADLGVLSADAEDAALIRSMAHQLHGTVSQLHRAPKPVVCGVNGVSAGGGIGLGVCGDIVLIAESARLEFAYPRIALSGDGGSTYLLPRLVGMRTAQEIAFRDEPIGAEEAVDIGLATEVIADDEFEARLTEEAERLASGPTKSYAATKGLLRKSFDNSLNEQLAEEGDTIAGLTDTEDFSRGHAAFNSDEEPEFTGE